MTSRKLGGPPVNLNLNVRGQNPSATIAINELCNRLIREGRQIYKLGLGQSPFPVPREVVAALAAKGERFSRRFSHAVYEVVAQLRASSVQAALHGSSIEAERLRDLQRREALYVPQDVDCSEIEGQSVDRVFE